MSEEDQTRPTQENSRSRRHPTSKAGRRRRWPRRLLIALALLPVLVWLTPYLLSTGAGTRLMLSVANPRLKGRLQVRDLSLSWLSGLEVHGLKVFDPIGREVLEVETIRTAHGLWHAIWAWEDFTRVSVEAPRAVLYVRPEADGGGISLANALSPAKPRPKARRPLPELRGQIGVASASLQVVLADGRTIELPGIKTNIDLSTLDRIVGTFEADLPGEGKLKGEFDLRGLVDGGKARFGAATGRIALHTEGEAALGPLAAFAGRKGVRGRVALKKGEARFEPDRLTVDFDLAVSRLAAPHPAQAQVEPVDLDLDGQVKVVGDDVTAGVNLTGQVGWLKTNLTFDRSGRPATPDPAGIISAVLAGEPVELPRFQAKADGRVDLAALARALPALMKLRPDVEVAAGTLVLSSIAVAGGSSPSAGGRVELKDLTARRGAKAISFQPITVEFDALVRPAEGLEVRRATLQAQFAHADASGTAKSLKGRFDADLSLLHRRLAEIFELGRFELGGKITGTAEVARESDNQVNLTLGVRAVGLRYRSARGELKVQKAVLQNTGYVTLVDGRCERVTVTRADVTLDDALKALAAGWYGLKDGSFDARVDVKRADLAYLGRSAAAMGFPQLRRYAGTARLTATAARPSAEAPVVSSGDATVRGLRVDGTALSDKEVTFRWADADIQTEKESFSVKLVRLRSAPVNLTAVDVSGRYRRRPGVKAHVTVDADLAGCAAAARSILNRDDLPDPTGRLALTGNCGLDDTKLSFKGNGRAFHPQTGPGEKVFLAFEARASYDTASRAFGGEVEVRRADLAYFAAHAKDLGFEPLSRCAGTVSVRAGLARPSAEAPIATSGSATLAGLRVDGRAVTDKEIKARWKHVEIRPAGSFAAESVELESGFARLKARGVRLRLGDDVVADGKLDLTADLAECLAVARLMAGWKETPAVAGRFSFFGAFGSADGNITLDGSGGVDDFQAGADDKAVREKRVDLRLAAVMDRQAKVLSLKQLTVGSSLLTATASGTIEDLRAERKLDLKGHYRASWERLSKVLHELAPDLAGKFELAGPVESDFTAVGPLHRPTFRPVFRGVRAGTEVGWTSGRAYGLRLGQARLSPVLADGQVVLPPAAIPASGGTVRVGGIVDLTGARPMLRIEKLQVLERVPLNVELGEVLLSRFNPIFHKMNVARLAGKVSLLLENVALPLDESIKAAGAGGGRLELTGLELLPSGWLAELLRIGGVDPDQMQQVRVSDLLFTIDRGRVRYRDFTVTFAEVLDLRFDGAVYFDDRLDMTVSVPVRAGLLRKLGVTGPAADYARLLEGARLGVPIRGTRQKPRLDWKSVDWRPLVRRAVQAYLAERAAKILKPDRDEPGPQTRPGEPPATQPAKTPEEQIIESIFDLLRKKL